MAVFIKHIKYFRLTLRHLSSTDELADDVALYMVYVVMLEIGQNFIVDHRFHTTDLLSINN